MESILRDGEEVVYRTKLHWVVVLCPLLAALLSVPVTVLSREVGLPALGQLWVGFATIWVAASVINYLISELGVTDQRIIGKVGFLSGKLLDRDLATIEEIRVTHGALGRALGYGSLLVRARGKPELRIDSLLDPEQFRQAARGQSPENARDGD